MFAKLTVVILAIVLTAAALLALRQQRYELGHQMVETTRRIDQARRELWEVRTHLAARVNPHTLNQAIAQAQLKLETLVPLDAAKPQPPVTAVAIARHSTRRGN
jgi:hypothetical protein